MNAQRPEHIRESGEGARPAGGHFDPHARLHAEGYSQSLGHHQQHTDSAHKHLPKFDLHGHEGGGKSHHALHSKSGHKGHHSSTGEESGSPEAHGKPKSADGRASSANGESLAECATNVANKMHSLERCAAGVETALGKVGISLTGNAADTARSLSQNSHFKEVPPADMQRGDVVVRGRSGSHPDGHIFVYLGQGMEASDHIQKLTNGSVYGPSRVFRLK